MIDVGKLREMLKLCEAEGREEGFHKWEVRPCSNPLRKDTEDPLDGCWCAMVYYADSPVDYSRENDKNCIIPCATIHRRDAELYVELHNMIPKIIAMKDEIRGLQDEIRGLERECGHLQGDLDRAQDSLDQARDGNF